MLTLGAFMGRGRGDEPGDVVARVGDVAIERQEIDALLSRLGGAAGDADQQQRVRAAVLDQIIDERIVRTELARAGAAVDPAAVDAAIDRLREQVAAHGKDLATALAASGRTIDSLREQASLEMTIAAYVQPRMTEDSINRVFENHRRELDGTRLRVSHIVLRPDAASADAGEALRKQADAIRSEIVQGRLSFADAARQFSAGPSRRVGGDLGWITPEGPMLETFSSEVYPLAKGGISEPFLTIFGVHIATVTAVQPGRVGLSTVRSRVEKLLAAELVRALVAEGREKTPISVTPGVPHFDPSTLGQPAASRPVVVQAADE
jgi:parvulin-like peptidyl-prolyl isomerase